MNRQDADDILAVYKQGLANIAPLPPEEVQELFRELRRWGKRDEQREQAAKKLLEAHLLLVVESAEKHLISGISLVELIQEGNLALFGAMESYAENPSGDFRSYAATRIEDALTKVVSKND